jgi:N-acyl-D-amino-acid deacylase
MSRTLLLALLLTLCTAACAVLSAGEREATAADPLPVTGVADPRLASFDRLMVAFLEKHQVPGGALAVAQDGRLVYARGFGYADLERESSMQANSLLRIASVSKPITAAAILLLVQQGKLRLTDRVFDLLTLRPPPGAEPDPRLQKITVLHLLQHTAGWDRGKSFDPMFRPIRIARALGVPPPAEPEHIIRYMLGQPLDFDPGARYAYSNFGYCVLGRVIEKVSGQPYEQYVRQHVLGPLGIRQARVGKTLLTERAPREVKYYDYRKRTDRAVVGPDLGKQVPLPYGTWYLEAMDAHGGWIASAVDLVRFGSAFDAATPRGLLGPQRLETLFARPAGTVGETADGKPRRSYYGCGWSVRLLQDGQMDTFHNGLLDGTASLLVRRHDGLCWAVIFNAGHDRQGRYLSGLIDPLLHEAANQVKEWPRYDLFGKLR